MYYLFEVYSSLEFRHTVITFVVFNCSFLMQALCESLEETVYNLKREVAERDRKILTLTEELSNATRRIESLTMQQMM